MPDARPPDHPGATRSPAAPRLSTLGWSARMILAVSALGVLAWAWRTSEMDPGVLVTNATKAREYVFGRELDEGERERLEARAQRTALLGLLATAEEQERGDRGLSPSAPAPDDLEQAVARRADRLRAEMGDEAWQRRIDLARSRMERDARGGYFPPTTDPEKMKGYLDALLETLAIAIWGTLLAAAAALPSSLLGSARSLAIMLPGEHAAHRFTRRLLAFFGRRVFDICRGFNEFVLALILIAVIGLGPFAGVLALAVHTFGVLGKVFADAIEAVRPGEVEGVTATGASPPQVISYALLPQIMPYVVSQTLLRFESNVRSASVLGIVGAGGIGFLIDAKLKAYQYREVATMMILIIVVVSLIDFLCGRIMKRFV
jgi:phosphonate transport system permease protein